MKSTLDRLARDIRLALRGFRRSPTFTVTVVLILTIGIGMAVAMYTVFEAVLLRGLPVRDQDRIVQLHTYRGDPNTDFFLIREDLPKVAATSRTMREIGGFAHWGAVQAPYVYGDRPVLLNRANVTGNFFDVLGGRPMLGRYLRVSDEVAGAEPVMVLSYATWRGLFAGDSSVVGKRLLEPYGRLQYRIVGVAPPGLDYPTGVGLWEPLWQPSAHGSVIAVARLAPGATPLAAQTEFFETMKNLFPDRDFAGARARTFTRVVLGDIRPILDVLVAAVALLLVIACVNVGNLLLHRATGRLRELSIRRALGASLGDLARQMAVESTVLGAAGGVLGWLFAGALTGILVAVAPRQLPRTDVIALAGTPVAGAFAVTLVAILLFGVVPAMIASRGQLAAPLRFDSRAGTEATAHRRIRQILVASQVALALVLLAAAGLLGRSLEKLQGIALGWNPEHLALLSVSFPGKEYQDSTGQLNQLKLYAVGERLLAGYRAVPGVAAVTPMLVPPFLGSGIFIGRLDKEGQTADEMKSNTFIPVEACGADYFRAYGIPIERGRGFTDADREDAAQVAVVSEATAKREWPNEDPIGKRIRYWSTDTTAWRTVVGVAGDIRYRSLRDATPTVYIPWRQSYWQGSFVVRTTGDIADVAPALRRATQEVEPAFTLWQTSAMDDLLAGPLSQPRLSAALLAAFAIVSLLLAAIGLYGVMASIVRAGMRELGVRAALGASPERLQRGILLQALAVTGAGAIVGLGVALVTSRLLASLLFEVSPIDPVSLAGSAIVLLLVSLVAAFLPARRATRADPVQTLRAD